MTLSSPSPLPTASIAALQAFVLAMPMARTLGLRFVHAEAGRVEVEIPVTEAFSFRPGQLQATAVFAVADFAADVFAVDGSGQETLCATLLATARNIEPAPPAVGRRRAGVSPASAAPARRPPAPRAPAPSAPC